MSDGTKDYLLSQIHRHKAQADEILAEAEKVGRDNTPEETSEFEQHMKQITDLQLEVKKLDDREEMRKRLEAIGAVTEIATADVEEVQAKSLGEAVISSAEYKAVMESVRGGGMPKFTLPTIELKATGDPPILTSDGSNASAMPPTRSSRPR